MSGKPVQRLARLCRLALATLVALTLLLPQSTVTATADFGDRTIYLHHTHTGETGRFTFRRNGQYDQAVLKQLNVFLADWRTRQPTKMDPALFDLLWTVYQEVGASNPINIVSSYRAPETNAMLRKKSSGVAENSQHMKGKAIDFFIPGISLSLLRETVMRHQVGGIGYYPTSGSPFVHADTGSVRAWPRMTRAQLKKVFPDGRTLHLPTDGKPLSDAGRLYAETQWKECHAVPCNNNPVLGGFNDVFPAAGATMLASLDGAPIPAVRSRVLASTQLIDGMTAAEPAPVQVASIGGDPAQRVVSTFEIVAPIPVLRHDMLPGGMTADGAPIPAHKSQSLLVATLYSPPTYGDDGVTALAALDDAIGAPMPRPRVLMTRLPDVAAAYVGAQEPGAEEALRMIIERETTASVPDTTAALKAQLQPSIHTASLASDAGSLDGLKGMFDLTFNALSNAIAPSPVASALAGLAEARQPNHSIGVRNTDLVAPELDHVNETLVLPVFMSGSRFAEMTEAEGYLDKETELGPLTGRIGFLPEPAVEPSYDRFVVGAPLIVAAN